MSNQLPSSNDVEAWLAAELDPPTHLVGRGGGRGWRTRALRGKTVVQVMATLPTDHHSTMRTRRDEWLHVAAAIKRSGMNMNQVFKLAVARYLIDHHDLDPADVPDMLGEK